RPDRPGGPRPPPGRPRRRARRLALPRRPLAGPAGARPPLRGGDHDLAGAPGAGDVRRPLLRPRAPLPLPALRRRGDGPAVAPHDLARRPPGRRGRDGPRRAGPRRRARLLLVLPPRATPDP